MNAITPDQKERLIQGIADSATRRNQADHARVEGKGHEADTRLLVASWYA